MHHMYCGKRLHDWDLNGSLLAKIHNRLSFSRHERAKRPIDCMPTDVRRTLKRRWRRTRNRKGISPGELRAMKPLFREDDDF